MQDTINQGEGVLIFIGIMGAIFLSVSYPIIALIAGIVLISILILIIRKGEKEKEEWNKYLNKSD